VKGVSALVGAPFAIGVLLGIRVKEVLCSCL
jgi:hypothetical protein